MRPNSDWTEEPVIRHKQGQKFTLHIAVNNENIASNVSYINTTQHMQHATLINIIIQQQHNDSIQYIL